MTGDDDLRARITRVDPTRRAADALPSPTAAEIQERVMQTIESATETPGTERDQPLWRRPLALAAAGALVLVLAAGAVIATSGDDPAPRAPDQTTLALSLPDPAVASSCVQFDVAFLREMPVAFSGTVTAITAEAVTLDVDRWYKGGSADLVTVAVPAQQTSAALDGVDFTEGQSYLVSATDGTVNGCGFSGPATPELEAAYGQAFAG